MAPQLVIDALRYSTGNQPILGPIAFDVQAGEKLAIAGPTGAGKSTLLKLIGGLLQPTEGTICYEGQKVVGPMDQLIPGHPRIAYHSQHFELHNNYLVYDFVEYRSQMDEPDLTTLFKLCRINHLMGRKTNSGLSGGEKQRIVLAKTLAKMPGLLLLDEPFSNLDAQHSQLMQQVVHDICAHYGITSIMVSHDVPQLLAWANRVATMHHGLITQIDTPEQLYQQPATPQVAAAMGMHQWLDAPLALALGYTIAPDSSLLVRPHHWAWHSTPTPNSLEATVQQVRFAGAQYHIIWVAGAITIEAHMPATQTPPLPGSLHYLHLHPNYTPWALRDVAHKT